jgi:hypothetical protein
MASSQLRRLRGHNAQYLSGYDKKYPAPKYMIKIHKFVCVLVDRNGLWIVENFQAGALNKHFF